MRGRGWKGDFPVEDEACAKRMPQTKVRADVEAKRRGEAGVGRLCPAQEGRVRLIEWKHGPCAKACRKRRKRLACPVIHGVTFRITLSRKPFEHGSSGIADQQQGGAAEIFIPGSGQPPERLK